MQIISTDASPPPELSFAYMLAGVAGMGVAAGLLLWQPEALLTRWHPAALAAVHVFALGGLMPVMLGALFQFVPVACGLSLPRWGWGDVVLLLLLLGGAASLATGFLEARPALYAAAGVLLLGSLGAAGWRLLRAVRAQAQQAEVVGALSRSAVALGVTLLLAAVLLGILLFGWNLPLLTLVDWHALWAIGGWVAGLIVGVASVVVPMFHVSPAYPLRWLRTLRLQHWLLGAGLLAGLLGWAGAGGVISMVLAALLLGFGGLTVQRVVVSKRGEKDAFYWGWLMVGVLAILLALVAVPACWATDPRWGVAFGVLALPGLGGFTVSVMLYRIVPFLIWLHWQRANKARARLPLLHRIVPELGQRIHLGIELCAILLLALGAFLPAVVSVAAAAMLAGKLLQGVLLARAMHDFRQRLAVLRTLPPRSRAPA